MPEHRIDTIGSCKCCCQPRATNNCRDCNEPICRVCAIYAGNNLPRCSNCYYEHAQPKCKHCGQPATKWDANLIGFMVCQNCGDPLCRTCAIYANDNEPRSKRCHLELSKCDNCQGNTSCDYCELDKNK